MNGSIENKETKECPYCAETILKKAKICRHCKKIIENSVPDTENNIPVTDKTPAYSQIAQKGFGFKWVIVAVILLIILFGYKIYKDTEDRDDCELAERSNIKEAWKEYIEKHADGKCAVLAASRIKEKIKEEEKRAEELRIAEERRIAEEKRIAEERRIAEEKRIAEERRIAEELRKELEKWSKKAPNIMNWNEAKAYCANLDEAGYSDWRLPTISELRTLIKNCPATESGGECKVTNECLSWDNCWSNACKGCAIADNGRYSKLGDTTGVFWSSSQRSDDAGYAWYVYFYGGGVGANYENDNNNLNVRCLR